MNIMSKMNPANLFRKSTPATLTMDQVGELLGFAGYQTMSGISVNERTALQVSAVFAAVRVIGEGVASMPISLKKDSWGKDGLRRTEVMRGHWASNLIRRPNPWQTGFEFVEWMVEQAALGGGALAVKNTVGGQVRELIPVPLGSWAVRPLPDYSLAFDVTYIDGTTDTFADSQVLYLKGPSFDGYQGLSAVKHAREAIGLAATLENQQARFSSAGGKPSGVLSFENALSAERREKLRKTWMDKFGPGGSGGVAILDGKATFQSMVMTSVDAQLLETRRLQIEEIARFFRVLPLMLMQADKAATFASVEQMSRMHVMYTLMPWVRRLEEAMHRDILGLSVDLYFDFDERSLLRGDHAVQGDYYTKALGAGGQGGWMTPNEIREECGLNPSDEAWAGKIPQGAMTASGTPANATSSGQ